MDDGECVRVLSWQGLLVQCNATRKRTLPKDLYQTHFLVRVLCD